MEKAKSPKQTPQVAPKTSFKMPDESKHKNMHPESLIPPSEPEERDVRVPTPHVDDDPESYRLT